MFGSTNVKVNVSPDPLGGVETPASWLLRLITAQDQVTTFADEALPSSVIVEPTSQNICVALASATGPSTAVIVAVWSKTPHS
jgi:hypothetical protein